MTTTTTQPEPTELETTTTVENEAAPPFAPAPAECLELPPVLAELPSSGFIVMPEDRIFDCLGVESFQSTVSFDGLLPSGPASAVAESVQRIDDGVVSATATFIDDGELTEDLVRIGETVWTSNEAGGWDEGDLDLSYFFSEQGEARLNIGGALFIFSVYGGGAVFVEEVELNGRTVELWQADAGQIALYFNSLNLAPFPADLAAGFINVWTTEEGLIVKLEGEIRSADVSIAGVPVSEIDPTVFGLPADALDIVPDYSLSYELFDFDHDIEITDPLKS